MDASRFGIALRVAILLACSSNAEEPQSAWWMTAHFDATDDAIRSIPVNELDEDWKRASLLTESSIQRFESPPDGVFSTHGFRFELGTNLDGDSKEERVSVGVYETNSGESGRFLVIIERDPNGSWHKVFLSSVPGAHNFSALLVVGDEVRWYSCMACGHFETLRWRAGSYALE